MNNRIKYIFILPILLGFIALCSCDKYDDDVCDQSKICYTQKPDSLYVKLSLSKNPGNIPIEVHFYKDYFDKGTLLDHYYTFNSEIYYLVPRSERYTATAKYLVGSDTVMVIDSDKLGDGSYTNCDQSCYNWNEEIDLDLTLKQ